MLKLANPPVTYDAVTVKRGHSIPVAYYYVTRDAELPHLMEWLAPLKTILIDTETGGLNPRESDIATLQIGHPEPPVGDPRVYVIDMRCVSEEALAPIRDVLANRKVTKLGQNIKFELLFLGQRRGWKVRNVADTQVTELLLRAGLLNSDDSATDSTDRAAYSLTSMAKLCDRYLEINIDKDHDLRTSFYSTPPGNHSERQVRYAAGDCIYPWYILKEQGKEIKDRGLESVLRVEFEVLPVLAETELRGIRIDAVKWRLLWQDAVKRQDLAERKLDRLFLEAQGDLFNNANTSVRPVYTGSKKPVPLNWSSPAQVKWAIERYCKFLGWPVQTITTPGVLDRIKLQEGRDWCERKGIRHAKAEDIPEFVVPESKYCILLKADQPTLKLAKIRKQLPAEFVDAVLAYQHEKPLVSTFGKDFLKKITPDGRIHFEFHQLIAATGRMSSQPSSMNIPAPEPYRRCFQPMPGYKFVILDYSQIEPRISAFVSQDEVYNRTFADDTDLYCTVAEAMLGYYPNVEAQDPVERDKATKDRKAIKAVVLGMAYKMGAGKLRNSLTLALKEDVSFSYAAELHRTFCDRCTGLIEFQDECAKRADPASPRKIWDRVVQDFVTWIEAPCGRKRFFRKNSTNTVTESSNLPIQGLAATQLKAAIAILQRHIDDNELDAHAVNFIHDEVVYEVREDLAPQFALDAKRILEQAAQFYIPTVRVKAEFPKGSNGVVDFWTKDADKDPDA